MQINKFVRYCLIMSCLNVIFAGITAGIVWISRIYNWQWYAWKWYDWYIFGSVLIPIAVFIIYLSPVIEQILYNKLQEKMISINENQILEHKKRIIELDKELIELKKME